MSSSTLEALRGYLDQGGFVMWPLLLCTLVLWYALGYRFVTLQRGSRRTVHRLIEDYQSGRGRMPKGVVDSACILGVRVARLGSGSLRPLLDDAYAALRHELKAGKTTIKSVVAAAPLLGLLGTVTGMIETFDSLADMSFFAQSGGIAGGIAEALFTTQMGLVVAVPGVIIGRLLDRRQATLEDELERIKDVLCNAQAEARASQRDA